MTRPRILYLEPRSGVSSGFKYMINKIFEKNKCQLNVSDCFFINLNRLVQNTYVEIKKGQKIKYEPNKNDQVIATVRKVLNDTIVRIKPTHIVVNCGSALGAITGKQFSLANNRGSVYLHGSLQCIVFDDLLRTQDTLDGTFLLANDCKKLSRFVHNRQRAEPRFVYSVCNTVHDCERVEQYLLRCELISVDIETKGTTITSIQFAGLMGPNSGLHEFRIQNFVIPFLDARRPNGAHWDTEESEIAVWGIIKRILASRVVKVGHNAASYDAAVLLKYNLPIDWLLFDTMIMWHAMFAQLRKSLEFVTSICVDHYTFWKEDNKGVKDELEITDEGMENFWKYGALDVYYTMLDCIYLIGLVRITEYARVNYLRTFPRQIGPCLAMSCRGLKIDFQYLGMLRREWHAKDEANFKTLAVMVDNKEFNPISHVQVKNLFFDVLGAEKVRVKGGFGSSSEDALKMIGDQHPLYKLFADAVLNCRETRKLITTYLYAFIRGKRFHYSMNATGTYTERLSSSDFLWEGQNAQNIPDLLRGFFIANNGYFFFDIDLEQSDARYVAYESQDLDFIRNVESGKDTHCIHASHFFKEGYDSIFAKVKAGIEKYAHKATGIRAITKRIVHGANYQMAAYTLYTQMGREAVVAAAKAIGIHNAATFTVKQLVKVCEKFLEDYHVLYKRLRIWHREITAMLKKSRSLTTCYGWTCIFFGDPDDQKTQREGTGFLGQGGTAGCINRALDFGYWGNRENNCAALDGDRFRFLVQVHDSIVGMAEISQESADKIVRLIEYMQWPVEIKGRRLVVPAAATIGVRWGGYRDEKGDIRSFTKKVTIEQLKSGEWKKILGECMKFEDKVHMMYAA